jgi:hypothetical protein
MHVYICVYVSQINIKKCRRGGNFRVENVKEKPFKALGVQFMIKHLEYSLIMGSDSFPISDTILTKALVVIL